MKMSIYGLIFLFCDSFVARWFVFPIGAVADCFGLDEKLSVIFSPNSLQIKNSFLHLCLTTVLIKRVDYEERR